MSRKQEIYKEMLRWGLPFIRDVLAQSAWTRFKDRSALLEVQLLHSLPHSILNEEFTDNDLWFLNHHARTHLSEASSAVCKNYELHRRLIAELFRLVPAERRTELKWNGPEA